MVELVTNLVTAELGLDSSFPPASAILISMCLLSEFVAGRTSLNELTLKDKFQIKGN